MEEIIELLIALLRAIIEFIIAVTFHALVFIYLIICAIFSRHYRQKLREKWNTSSWMRFTIVFGVMMYSAALVIALTIWIPFTARSQDKLAIEGEESGSEITIKFNSREVDEMMNTKEIDELVETAGGLIKRKLEERKKRKQTQQEEARER